MYSRPQTKSANQKNEKILTLYNGAMIEKEVIFMFIQKKSALVRAWQLGAGSDTERSLIACGALRKEANGTYKVFSRESPDHGQIARPGDYIKLDNGGFPYPNEAAWFEENHTHLDGDRYLQRSPVKEAWFIDETPSAAAAFLLENDLLQLNQHDPDHFFGAHLWGTYQTAPHTAVVVFDKIAREGSTVSAVDFHFITREEFRLSYEVVR